MDYLHLSPGDQAPEVVLAIIEIPESSDVKYELDKKTGIIMADRFLHGSNMFPFNYGFIPGTMTGDGDPTDIIVISSARMSPGTGIKVRPIGMLEMQDEEGQDAKIVSVPIAKVDPFYAHVESIDDIDEPTKLKIKHFFDTYKMLEKGKFVKTGNFIGKDAAYKEINDSIVKK
jgi:inorganic pyrophosphatase